MLFNMSDKYTANTIHIAAHGHAVPFYRYWNGHEHFYTTNADEIGTTTPGLRGRHNYVSEGIQCRIHSNHVSGTVPLYRYYNGFEHFYTTDPHEIGTTTPGVVGNHGYRHEGIAGYCYPSRSDGNTPLHRGYKHGDHFYTTDCIELLRSNIPYEGVACYVGPK